MDILQIRNINQKFQLFCENKADFEKLDDLIRNIRDYLSKIKIDENQIIKEKTYVTSWPLRKNL
ncbi:hypothetical protein HZS_7027 [Henneguya salminicola]|nr:hypothetical protein HZS_7027 [Henneguya salminicola]